MQEVVEKEVSVPSEDALVFPARSKDSPKKAILIDKSGVTSKGKHTNGQLPAD